MEDRLSETEDWWRETDPPEPAYTPQFGVASLHDPAKQLREVSAVCIQRHERG